MLVGSPVNTRGSQIPGAENTRGWTRPALGPCTCTLCSECSDAEQAVKAAVEAMTSTWLCSLAQQAQTAHPLCASSAFQQHQDNHRHQFFISGKSRTVF